MKNFHTFSNFGPNLFAHMKSHTLDIESQWKFEILAHHQMGICGTKIMIHGDFLQKS